MLHIKCGESRAYTRATRDSLTLLELEREFPRKREKDNTKFSRALDLDVERTKIVDPEREGESVDTLSGG